MSEPFCGERTFSSLEASGGKRPLYCQRLTGALGDKGRKGTPLLAAAHGCDRDLALAHIRDAAVGAVGRAATPAPP
eukprot:5042348-Prymnesium_polylepis.4